MAAVAILKNPTRPVVVSNGQPVADGSIYCIKVQFKLRIASSFMLFPPFLLLVWSETAVGGLFSSVTRVLRCAVASRLARSATGRQPTTGILLSVQREVNIRRRRSPGVLFCHPDAFGSLTCEFRRQYLRFPSNRKWLSLDRK